MTYRGERWPVRARPRAPPRSMSNFLQDAAQAVGTGSATGRDGAELIADDTRQALANARNLAAKLLGEEPQAELEGSSIGDVGRYHIYIIYHV